MLIQWDQGVTGEKKKKPSKILALHLRDGALLWEAKRPVGASWSSPIIISTPSGYQLVTCSNPLVIAYDPSKGNELWRAEVLEGDGGPSPSYAKGLVYAANVDSYLACIRPDGRGEVTKSHVVWKAEEGLPDICSILTDGRHVWLLETAGALTCYDAKAGRQLYLQDVLGEDMSFVSSPTLVGDKLMLIGESGKVLIVSTGPKFKQLGISDLGEDCETCPAFAKGRMYIRGQKHLFCIGAKD